jgi:hypothetical protein
MKRSRLPGLALRDPLVQVTLFVADSPAVSVILTSHVARSEAVADLLQHRHL